MNHCPTQDQDSDLEYTEQPDLAIAALLHMLSRFPVSGSASLGLSILHHLRYVAADARYPASLRHTAAILGDQWQQRLAGETAAERTGSEAGSWLH